MALEGQGRFGKGCAGCNKSFPEFWCKDCTHGALWCQTCLLERHHQCPLHVVEVSCLIPLILQSLLLTDFTYSDGTPFSSSRPLHENWVCVCSWAIPLEDTAARDILTIMTSLLYIPTASTKIAFANFNFLIYRGTSQDSVTTEAFST